MRLGTVWQARHGAVWLGLAWQGQVRYGKVRFGRYGMVGLGKVGHGMAGMDIPKLLTVNKGAKQWFTNGKKRRRLKRTHKKQEKC